MKNKRNNLFIFCLFLLITFLVVGVFYKRHYTSDSYIVMDTGYFDNGLRALSTLRPIQSILYFFVSNFDISYINLYRIYLTISIFICASCCYILFRIFSNNKNKISKIYLILCILIIFLNPYTAENMLFIENINMWLACLLSIIASIIYLSKIRYKTIVTALLLILAVFSYQAMLNIFIPLTILIVLNKNGLDYKINIKDIIKIFAMYLVPYIICFISYKTLYNLFPYSDLRLKVNLLLNISYILNSFIIYSIISIIELSIIYLIYSFLSKKLYCNDKVIYNCLVLIICTIFANVMVVFGSSAQINPRMIMTIGGIIGIIGIYILNNNIYLDKKNIKVVIFLLFIIFIMNTYNYINNAIINMKSTVLNENIIDNIVSLINKYEEDNNIKIKNVSFYSDMNPNYKIWGDRINAYTYPVYYVSWSRVHVFNYKLNRNLNELEYDDTIYEKYFKNKNWDYFSDEQVIFDGDNIYICTF